MMHVLRAVLLALLLAAPAAAAPVEFTFNAPVDVVWEKTLAVLRVLGWGVDKDRVDRSIGFIVTDSRRVHGHSLGVSVSALPHRLHFNARRASDSRSSLRV